MKIKINVNTLMQFREEKKYYFKGMITTIWDKVAQSPSLKANLPISKTNCNALKSQMSPT